MLMKEYTAKKEYMILQGHVSTQVLLSLSKVDSTLQAIDPLNVVQAVHYSIDQKEQVPLHQVYKISQSEVLSHIP